MITNGYVKFDISFKDGVITLTKEDTNSTHRLRIPADLAESVAKEIINITAKNKLGGEVEIEEDEE